MPELLAALDAFVQEHPPLRRAGQRLRHTALADSVARA
jgi:hypothetical protein